MSNITITNVDLGSVALDSGSFNDGLINFTGAATLLEGTILAIDSVSKKWIPFVKGGTTNEDGIAKGVLTYPVTAAGAGDESARIMVAGRVKLERLVINADGDASNIDQDVRDGLRDYGIVSLSTEQLAGLDNQ